MFFAGLKAVILAKFGEQDGAALWKKAGNYSISHGRHLSGTAGEGFERRGLKAYDGLCALCRGSSESKAGSPYRDPWTAKDHMAEPGSDHEKHRSCVPLTRFTPQGSGEYAITGKNRLPRGAEYCDYYITRK